MALAPLLFSTGTAPLSPAPAPHVRSSYPESLQDGDVIFRLGNDAMAALVLAQGKGSRYSHVGMLIKTADTWSVVHSIPPEPGVAGGVHAVPLDSFASPEVAAQVAFFRVTDLAKPLQIKAKEYLLGQIGKPFDYRFEFSDDSAHYCTELVVKALRNAEIDLEPSLARVHVIGLSEAALLPDSLSGSPRLRELTSSVPHAAIDLKLSH